LIYNIAANINTRILFKKKRQLIHNVFLTIEYFKTRTKYDEYTETALMTLICVHDLHKLYYYNCLLPTMK